MRPQLTVAAFINYGIFFIQVYTEHILQRLLLFDRDRNYSFPIYMQSWTYGLVLNDPLTFLKSNRTFIWIWLFIHVLCFMVAIPSRLIRSSACRPAEQANLAVNY